MRATRIYAGDASTVIDDPSTSRNGTETEESVYFALSPQRANWEASLVVVAVDGTPSFTIEHTLDNPSDADATWIVRSDSDGVLLTDPIDRNYAFPINGIRFSVTGGTARLSVLQAG